MKNIIILLFTLFAFNAFANNTVWYNSFEEAQKMALATNKPILLDFWADWCKPCLNMDADTWSNAEVKIELQNFIPLKLDITSEKQLAKKYNVRLIPNVLIIDPFGELINQYRGYKDEREMLKILRNNYVDLSFIQADYLDFYKKENADSALEIAIKYFDLSLLVNKNVKIDYINLAEKYLDIARKLYKKSGNKNKNIQLISILSDPYKLLMRQKYDKAIQALDNMLNEDDVLEENKSIYYFIHFVGYNKLADKENLKIWYEKLKTIENFQVLILKSRKM